MKVLRTFTTPELLSLYILSFLLIRNIERRTDKRRSLGLPASTLWRDPLELLGFFQLQLE